MTYKPYHQLGDCVQVTPRAAQFSSELLPWLHTHASQEVTIVHSRGDGRYQARATDGTIGHVWGMDLVQLPTDTETDRTASDPAGTTPPTPPATPLASRQQHRQRKDTL